MQFDPADLMVIPTVSDQISTDPVEINSTLEDKSSHDSAKTSHWTKLKVANRRIQPRQSRGDVRLATIINELKHFSVEVQDEIREDEQRLDTHSKNVSRRFRRRLATFLRQPTFHYTIIILVIMDLIVVLVDLILGQLSSPCLTPDEMLLYNTTEQRDTCLLDHSPDLVRGDLFLFYFSVILLWVFVMEIFITFYALGWKYYKNPLYFLDSTIVIASFIMELYFHYGNIGRAGRAAAAIVILRLWKIIRAIHAVAHSISLRNRLLIQKIQEAKVMLEEEKQQTEETLEKQDIKLEYLMKILVSLDKLPSTRQTETYVKNTWNKRRKNKTDTVKT